jgi:hypothetical protein
MCGPSSLMSGQSTHLKSVQLEGVVFGKMNFSVIRGPSGGTTVSSVTCFILHLTTYLMQL